MIANEKCAIFLWIFSDGVLCYRCLNTIWCKSSSTGSNAAHNCLCVRVVFPPEAQCLFIRLFWLEPEFCSWYILILKINTVNKRKRLATNGRKPHSRTHLSSLVFFPFICHYIKKQSENLGQNTKDTRVICFYFLLTGDQNVCENCTRKRRMQPEEMAQCITGMSPSVTVSLDAFTGQNYSLVKPSIPILLPSLKLLDEPSENRLEQSIQSDLGHSQC